MLLVVAAALCNGVAVVLQAQSARRPHDGDDRWLLVRLLRQPRYLAALVLVAAGFGCATLALRSLPLFEVQAGRAASLAVTALVAIPVLGARLRALDLVALTAVTGGLMLLAWTAPTGDSATAAVSSTPWLVPVAGLSLWAVGLLATRLVPGAASGIVAAVCAGLGFGLLAVAVRQVAALPLAEIVGQPAAWAAPAMGLAGLHFAAVALRRARVIAATATMVAVETCGAALAGLLWAGDRLPAGKESLAMLGFVLVLGGAVALARFGQAEQITGPDA